MTTARIKALAQIQVRCRCSSDVEERGKAAEPSSNTGGQFRIAISIKLLLAKHRVMSHFHAKSLDDESEICDK